MNKPKAWTASQRLQNLLKTEIQKLLGDFTYKKHAALVVCADDFTMSVQASRNHYCEPRTDDATYYNTVEVGFPSQASDLLMEYAGDRDHPTQTVYGYVPESVVLEVIEAHGGFKEQS